jgi:hypothetical protein
MRKSWITALLTVLIAVGMAPASFGQTAQCPPNLVCITPAAARKALQDSDTVKAQAVELDNLKTVIIPDLRKQLDDMRLEFVRADTKATALEKQAIRDAAIIELLLKMVRAKKIGLLNF